MFPAYKPHPVSDTVKRIVLAWDSDYTKLTPAEAVRLAESEQGEYFDSEEIDWEHLDKYE